MGCACGSSAPPAGADRFVWRVDARCGDAEREAELADPDVQGPWRELIDAVARVRRAESAAADAAAVRARSAAEERLPRFFTGVR